MSDNESSCCTGTGAGAGVAGLGVVTGAGLGVVTGAVGKGGDVVTREGCATGGGIAPDDTAHENIVNSQQIELC